MPITATLFNGADWAKMSSATGGTGALTLIEIAGRPKWRDTWATGVQSVPYTISAENGMFEMAVGNYNAGTDVLERPDVVHAWAPGVGYTNVKLSLPTSGVRVGFALGVAHVNAIQSNLLQLDADIQAATAAIATKAPLAHTHIIANVTGLQAILDGLVAGTGGDLADATRADITTSGGGAVFTINVGVVDTTKLGGDVTTAGKAMLTGAAAAAQRTTLGLGTAATEAATAFAATSHGHDAAALTSGAIPTARMPALTGDVLMSAGQTATTIPLASIGTSKLGGDITAAGKTLLTGSDASVQRTALGLGTAATASTATFAAAAHGHNASDVTAGTLAAARMPALTGAVTTVAGAVATTLTDASVTLAKIANVTAGGVIGRATGAGTGVPTILTAAEQRTNAGFTALSGTVSAPLLRWDATANAGVGAYVPATATTVNALTGGDQCGLILKPVATNGTHTLCLYAPMRGRFDALIAKDPTGTCTANVRINGVSVTGISAAAITTTTTTFTATAANEFEVGAEITIVVTSATGMAGIDGVLDVTKLPPVS